MKEKPEALTSATCCTLFHPDESDSSSRDEDRVEDRRLRTEVENPFG
jgi:hypothetical protein